jgi:peptidoglycan-associated lipoprotein
VWERQNGQWLVWYEHFGGGPKIEQPKVAAVPPPTPTPTPEVAPPPPPKLTDAFFDFDKWNIRADQIATLEQDVQILKDNPDLKVIIEGHCDARGTYPYNDVLGEKRAKSAKAFLMKHGIAADRLETISYGKRRPFELGKGEEIWQANRRAHFTLVK